MHYLLLPLAAIILVLSSCSLKPVSKIRNITYSQSRNLKLDVYAPKKAKEPKKILVFVYGGNWVSGKKSIYRFFGKGMARKGIVCVVLDYRLSPEAEIAGMAADVAEAVKWVKDNSASFKGDSSNIYISGHSAGGHLAAMVATDNSYFEQLNIKNPVKGIVLIDSFGLDMYLYLSESKDKKDTLYKPVFSNDPVKWKKYSPVYYLNKNTPPFMQFVGGRTYPAITLLNNVFHDNLLKYQPAAPLILQKGKKHIPMIFQFYKPHAKPYKDILKFMDVR